MPLIRRRPLLRAAAIGGGAYAMGKHNVRAQQEMQDQAFYEGQQSAVTPAPPPQAPAPAPGAAASPGSGGVSDADVARLQELGKLREQGILTDEEFARQKALILG
jgi:Short C-terminal domain